MTKKKNNGISFELFSKKAESFFDEIEFESKDEMNSFEEANKRRREEFFIDIVQKVNQLSDYQLRLLTYSAFDSLKQSFDVETHSTNLINKLNFWKSEEALAVQDIGVFQESIQLLRDEFDNQSVDADGVFLNYLFQFDQHNPREVAKIMEKFFKCLLIIENKPQELKEIFFQNFPPSAEYLNCLDGTMERLEMIERDLCSDEKFGPFLAASQLAVLNITDDLKPKVNSANHVHLPKYLNFSLGVSLEKSIHPQSQLSFTDSMESHRNYSKIFKSFLIKSLIDSIHQREERIYSVFDEVMEVFPGIENENGGGAFYNKLSQAFESLGINSADIIIADDEGNFKLNASFAVKAVEDHQGVKFLNSQNVIIHPDDEYSRSLCEKRDLLSDNSKIFYSADCVDLISSLIKSSSSHESDLDNKLFAVEHLWMMSRDFANSPKINFLRICQTLSSDEGFFERLSNELSESFPSFEKKVTNIAEVYAAMLINPRFANTSNRRELNVLIKDFYTTEEIIDAIQSYEDAGILNEFLSNEFLPVSLMSRPDRSEIVTALVNKLSGHQPNIGFVKKLLAISSMEDDRNLSRLIIANLADDPRCFESTAFFHNLARNNDSETFEIVAGILGEDNMHLMRQKITLPGTTISVDPLRFATIFDSANFAEKYLQLNPIESLDEKGFFFDYVVMANKPNILDVFLKLNRDFVINVYNEGAINLFSEVAAAKSAECLIVLARAIAEAKFNQNILINSADSKGLLPIDYAIANDDVKTLNSLIQLGANPMIKDIDGLNVFDLALKQRRPLCTAAIMNGKYFYQLDQDGASCFYRFVSAGDIESAKFMIECGYDDKKLGKNSALHLAASSNNPELIKVLIELGSDPYFSRKFSFLSPVELSLSLGNVEATKAFGDAGINLDSMLLPLVNNKKASLLKTLISAGVDPNIFLKNGKGILESILDDWRVNTERRDSRFFAALIDAGFDGSIKSSNGDSIDFLALKYGLTAVSGVLKEDRIDEIFIERILKNDADGIDKVAFYANYRTIGDEPIDQQNIFLKNYEKYYEFANQQEGSEVLIKALRVIREKYQKKEVDKASFVVEPPKIPDQSEIFLKEESVSAARKESSEMPEPPSSRPINSQTNRVSKSPSNDNLIEK